VQSDRINDWGLLEYLVIDGAARITEGGAAETREPDRTALYAAYLDEAGKGDSAGPRHGCMAQEPDARGSSS
jgi:hypothetical protein